MSNELSPQGQGKHILWRYIYLDQYKRPAEQGIEVARKGIMGIWDRLRQPSSSQEPAMVTPNLHLMPPHQLDQIVPSPHWNGVAPALDGVLRDWLESDDPENRTQIIVGAPYSGTYQVTTQWAHNSQWRIIDPPSPKQVLEGGRDWLDQLFESDNSPVAVPNLERCYLRHHDGLMLIHRFFDRLWANPRRCLIACDSWAWAYLSKAIHIDSLLPRPFTLEAFNARRLQFWFGILSGGSGEGPFTFRQANNGQFILPQNDYVPSSEDKGPQKQKEAVSYDNEGEITDFLRFLASYSYGIPGVAWAIWRQSLRCASDDEVNKKAQKTAVYDQGHTIWVKPWPQLDFPRITGSLKGKSYLFILHTLLLHNGLNAQILPQLIPFSFEEIMESLHHLLMTGLLETEGGEWRITAFSYPVVRKFLEEEGYLIDPL